MASTSETGHHKNVSSFEFSFICSRLGANFNPSKTSLKLPATNPISKCRANITAVTSSSVAFNNAVNARIIAFTEYKN